MASGAVSFAQDRTETSQATNDTGNRSDRDFNWGWLGLLGLAGLAGLSGVRKDKYDEKKTGYTGTQSTVRT